MKSIYLSEKCLFSIFFLMMMCPKRTRLLELQSGEIKYNFTTIKPTHPDVEVFKELEGNPFERYHRSAPEPGFDLTKEEMIKFKIWPYGVIPYFVDNFSFDDAMVSRLHQILKTVNFVTGLRFVELTSPPEDENERWVFFINRRGVLNCEDYNWNNFTNKGVQRVVVGYDCLGGSGGALASTVLALVGVPPQHNAPNRDKYINVMMDNIIPEKRHMFQLLKNNDWLFDNVEYDFLSAGHYDFHKYTANGAATIVPKEAIHGIPVGEGSGMSPDDVIKIEMLYNFISRKRPKAKASDCFKMFKPGAEFHRFKPLGDIQIVPTSKSEQYFGSSVVDPVSLPNAPENVNSKEKEEVQSQDNNDQEKSKAELNNNVEENNGNDIQLLKKKRTRPAFIYTTHYTLKRKRTTTKSVNEDAITQLTVKQMKKNELKHKVEKMDDWKTSDELIVD